MRPACEGHRVVAEANRITEGEVLPRFRDGHHVFIGSLNGGAATYGWLATQRAHIGEVDVTLALPPETAYLWDFLGVELTEEVLSACWTLRDRDSMRMPRSGARLVRLSHRPTRPLRHLPERQRGEATVS